MRGKSPSIMRVSAGDVDQKAIYRPTTSRHHHRKDRFSYFTEFTLMKGLFYGAVVIYVIAVSIMVVLELFVTNEFLQCNEETAQRQQQSTTEKLVYGNPTFQYDPCRYRRLSRLLFMTREECAFGRCLLASVLLGGIVGWERRLADRPAGIRTMGLVSLGACLFSINSTFGFRNGYMGWDASRVSAAIPSGVGFLGAGLIFKQADKDHVTGDTTHVVHGLTTSASLWISSAVGVACAGELYFSAAFSVALLLTLLRFGPRQNDEDCNNNSMDSDDNHNHTEYSATGHLGTGDGRNNNYNNPGLNRIEGDIIDPELQPLRPGLQANKSIRSRAALGGIL